MKKVFLAFSLMILLMLAVSTAASATGASPDEPLAAEPTEPVAVEPDYPRVRSTAPAPGGITVSWSAYPGAVQYRLFILRADGSGWTRIADTDATSYTHTGLMNNTAYTYTVRALDAQGAFCSDFDRTGLTAVYLSAPVLSRVTNEYTGQRLSWNAVTGAVNYRVYLLENGAWHMIGTTAQTSFLNTQVQPGESYTYTVCCCTEDGSLLRSSCDLWGITGRFISAPEVIACTPVDGGQKITWTSVPGAERYRLFYKRADGSGWTKITDTAAASYTRTGLDNNTAYTYTVRAINAAGEFVSGFNTAGLTATYHSAPSLTGAVNEYYGQRVSWTPVPGAVRYKVYVHNADGAGWSVIGTTRTASYLYRYVLSGVNYTYTVRCITADGAQPESWYDKNGVSAVCYDAPEITGFTPVNGGVEVHWSAVEGADRYRLFRLTDSGWRTVATIAATSVAHTGLTDGTAYTYTVRALNRAGDFISGYNPGGAAYSYHAAPVETQVACEDCRQLVSWERPADVIGWQLYRKTPGGEWTRLLNTRKRTTYTDTSAEPSVPYAYALRYVDGREKPTTLFPVDVLYYYNGAVADGDLEWNGTLLHFENGSLRQGYVTDSGRLYYYDQTGAMMKSAIVGSDSEGYTVADENGVCCTAEEIRLAARFMAEHATGDTLDERMKTGYLYLSRNFPYNRTYDHPSKAEEMAALAIDMFTNERGNCYRYAACFACLARAAGYRARVVIGTTGGNPHGWVEVMVDGRWLICDPDADIPKYDNPDYYSYMMREHYWQITPTTRCEIVIDENGAAEWIQVNSAS